MASQQWYLLIKQSTAGGLAFYNAKVALPLGLSTLAMRLQNGYYRQSAAIVHDAQTIAANAEEFNGPDSMYTRLAKGWLKLLTQCTTTCG